MKTLLTSLLLASGFLLIKPVSTEARPCDRPQVRSGITFYFGTSRSPSYRHHSYAPRRHYAPPRRIIQYRPTYRSNHSGYLHRGTVYHVQKALRYRGYSCGPVDGIFGYQTRSALRQFQYDAGLRPTGRIDRSTLRCLGISY
jgi:hypothetical protein